MAERRNFGDCVACEQPIIEEALNGYPARFFRLRDAISSSLAKRLHDLRNRAIERNVSASGVCHYAAAIMRLILPPPLPIVSIDRAGRCDCSVSGSAVPQKAHSAVDRPMCQ